MAESPMPKKLGRYEIVRELGKGAMGIVYEGQDPNIGRRVAIKTARRDVIQASGMGEELMERFLREARAAGALNHPNIITIYDADEEDGIAYIAMEYLEGGDLRTIFERRNKYEVPDLVEMGACICEALAVAHDAGIVHRDIKPANILLPKGGGLKLADFGIAHTQDSSLTQDGAMIGTPHYMSPEQFMGQKVTPRSDLFSVAIILYELLTGEKPFTGGQINTIMHSVVKVDPIAPQELNFAVPVALSQVVMKALSKSPYDRYSDGRSMAAALRESLNDAPSPEITLAGTGSQVDATVTMNVDQGLTDAGATRVQQEEEAATRLQPGSIVTPAMGGAVASESTLASQAASVTPVAPATGLSPTAGMPPMPAGPGATQAATPPPGQFRSRMLIIGGGVLALVLLVAVATTLGGGGGEEAGIEGEVESVSTNAASAEARESFFEGASVVYQYFPTMEAYDAYEKQKDADPESVRAADFTQKPPFPVRLEVIDLETNSVVANEPNFTSGDTIYFEGAPQEVKLQLYGKNQSEPKWFGVYIAKPHVKIANAPENVDLLPE